MYGSRALNSKLYGIVCIINENEINFGTPTKLSDNAYSGEEVQAVALSENKVFILHTTDTSSEPSGNYLATYAMLCTISDTTITVNSDKKLKNAFTSTNFMSAVALSENKVFIVFTDSSTNYGIMICTINGTSISFGNSVKLNTSKVNSNISTIKISENKICVVFSDTNDSYLSSIICTINEDNTITLGTKVRLSTKSKSGSSIASIKISENKIFIFHINIDIIKKIYGLICTINKDDTITIGTDIALKEFDYNYVLHTSTIQLYENKIFIYYNNINDGINALMCIINNDVIETAKDIQVVDNNLQASYPTLRYALAVLINNNEMFVVHNSSNNFILQAMICTDEIYTEVNLLEKRADNIYGIAKTNAVEEQQVDVYRPKEVAV